MREFRKSERNEVQLHQNLDSERQREREKKKKIGGKEGKKL